MAGGTENRFQRWARRASISRTSTGNNSNSDLSQHRSVKQLRRASMSRASATGSKTNGGKAAGEQHHPQQQQRRRSSSHYHDHFPSNSGGTSMSRCLPDAPQSSVVNGWSLPPHNSFQVRGANYLDDKKKVPSGQFLFPLVTLDVFLTNQAPQDVAQDAHALQEHGHLLPGGISGGNNAQLPPAVFVVNFRLPWGILVCVFEIPERFVPYMRAGAGECTTEEETARLEQALQDMTPAERCACQFLMGSDAHKNQTLKIVPTVVHGPWMVRHVVGGKPAILGKMLPIQYIYGKTNPSAAATPAAEDAAATPAAQESAATAAVPQEAAPPSSSSQKNKARAVEYLEADLDICGSAAARGILNVARAYTQALTLDLGFVIQGNEPQQLPEQMLAGFRMHGMRPDLAPVYPLGDVGGDFSMLDDDQMVPPPRHAASLLCILGHKEQARDEEYEEHLKEQQDQQEHADIAKPTTLTNSSTASTASSNGSDSLHSLVVE